MQKILVIAQPNATRTATLSLIEAAGYVAIPADDGNDGMRLAKQHRPTLIICQWRLSDTDGHQILETVRQEAELSLTPFILLTDQSDRAHLRRSMELGANDCLVCPFTNEELTAAIATQLNLQELVSNRYVTVLRHAAERLNRLAHYDSLTDLPNYSLLHQRLSQAMKTALSQKTSIAFLSLSLDRLRQVNNVLGYSAGDALLRAASKRLLASLPLGTTLARLTGNQFAILLTDFDQIENVRTIADNLMDALSRPFSLPGQEVFVTTSVGIVFFPEHSEDLHTLLRQADAALDCAKRQKSNYCQIYRRDMPVASAQQIKMETWLRYGLERNEFEVHYQPQLNLRSNRIEGVEALIRWNHPEQGYISPAEFIPLAEATGLIVPIGQWVLETVCHQARQWLDIDLGLRHVSVNLSSVQFNQVHLTTQVAQILEQSGLPPDHLELEITETAVMQDAETAIDMLHELKDLGIRIAVDDFGTGYSSLGYLKQLPIDTLKIDNCFVRGVTSDPKNQVILAAAIQIGHHLDLSIVAEGVETEDEQAFLQQRQCDFAQGYFIGRPMAANALQARLQQPPKKSQLANTLA